MSQAGPADSLACVQAGPAVFLKAPGMKVGGGKLRTRAGGNPALVTRLRLTALLHLP